MALIKCSECGKEISSNAKKCPHCGINVNLVKCPECGAKLNGDESTCPECGFPVNKKNATGVIFENLDKITGAKSKSYVTFKDLFKNTFKKHSEEELDELFTCGSDKTTPDIKDIDVKNASAWVYFKIFVFFILAYIPTRIGYLVYGNLNCLPGMVVLGAFAVPVTILIFFFEINLFRNIPFYKVIKYFILGGALSLIIALLFFSLDINTDISTYTGALMVGLIEEIPKSTVVALFLAKRKKSSYILDGLLVGAAVGAGFAAFETAGYILRHGLVNGVDNIYGASAMLNIIKLRGFLAPGGHVAWAAIEGAALMYVKGFEPLNKKHYNDKRFLLMCLIPILLHGIWDMPIPSPYYIVQIILTVLAWIVIIYFINLGLKQIEEAKEAGIKR